MCVYIYICVCVTNCSIPSFFWGGEESQTMIGCMDVGPAVLIPIGMYRYKYRYTDKGNHHESIVRNTNCFIPACFRMVNLYVFNSLC